MFFGEPYKMNYRDNLQYLDINTLKKIEQRLKKKNRHYLLRQNLTKFRQDRNKLETELNLTLKTV